MLSGTAVRMATGLYGPQDRQFTTCTQPVCANVKGLRKRGVIEPPVVSLPALAAAIGVSKTLLVQISRTPAPHTSVSRHPGRETSLAGETISCVRFPHCPSYSLLIALMIVLTAAQGVLISVVTPAIGDSVPDRQRPLATAMWQLVANGVAIFLMSRFVLGMMDPGEHRIGPRGSIFQTTVAGAEH